MTILDRLTAPSSRSLAVMTGHGQSGEGRGRKASRGSPHGRRFALVLSSPSRQSSPSSL